VRSQDVVARWGGDEFLLILPETSREGAMVLAEKLRRAVAAEAEGGGCDVRFTVTLGISVYDKLGAASECIRGADEALLEGKRAGKNRAVLAAA
jgi:diguanylate cyclase (GGDEF)-like protein